MPGLITIGQFIASILSVGAVSGLISGEMSRRLADRAERKAHLNGLLCDLLELRYSTIARSEVTKAVALQLPGADAQLSVIITSAFQRVVDHTKLHEHYESAIVELAAIDPMLAYQLRSKNLVDSMLKPLFDVSMQNPAPAPVAAQALKIFDNVGATALDEAILRVARELGRAKRKQVRELLSKKQEMPQEVSQLFSLIPQAIKAAQSAQSQAQPPQSREPSSDTGAQAAQGSG
jgi:hypothetical protein